MALAIVACANIVFLVAIDLLSAQPSPYIGILAYMVAPGFLVAGLILIPLGMMVERRRRLKAAGVLASLPQAGSEQAFATQHRGIRPELRRDLLADQRRRQLQSVRVHRLGSVLRPAMSHRHASGIHRLPGFAARARGLRGLPRRLGRKLVCEVEALGRAPGLLHRHGNVPAPDSDAGQATCVLLRRPASSVTGRRSSGARS